MAITAIAAYFNISLDVRIYFTAQLAFNFILMLDVRVEQTDLIFSEVFNPYIGRNLIFKTLQYLGSQGTANAVHVGKRHT